MPPIITNNKAFTIKAINKRLECPVLFLSTTVVSSRQKNLEHETQPKQSWSALKQY